MPYSDPAKQRKAVRESQRKRRVGLTAKKIRKTAPVRIRAGGDVLAVLEECVQEIRAFDCDPIIRGRTLAYISGVILKAVEVVEVEERLADIEKRMEEQHGSPFE